jgi:hypothetical protein
MPHLPLAHHETSKHDSPNETKIKQKQNETIPDSNSNLAQVNDSSQSNQGTDHLVSHFSTFPYQDGEDEADGKKACPCCAV